MAECEGLALRLIERDARGLAMASSARGCLLIVGFAQAHAAGRGADDGRWSELAFIFAPACLIPSFIAGEEEKFGCAIKALELPIC